MTQQQVRLIETRDVKRKVAGRYIHDRYEEVDALIVDGEIHLRQFSGQKTNIIRIAREDAEAFLDGLRTAYNMNRERKEER